MISQFERLSLTENETGSTANPPVESTQNAGYISLWAEAEAADYRSVRLLDNPSPFFRPLPEHREPTASTVYFKYLSEKYKQYDETIFKQYSSNPTRMHQITRDFNHLYMELSALITDDNASLTQNIRIAVVSFFRFQNQYELKYDGNKGRSYHYDIHAYSLAHNRSPELSFSDESILGFFQPSEKAPLPCNAVVEQEHSRVCYSQAYAEEQLTFFEGLLLGTNSSASPRVSNYYYDEINFQLSQLIGYQGVFTDEREARRAVDVICDAFIDLHELRAIVDDRREAGRFIPPNGAAFAFL